jgi:hypothetical protein
MTIILKDLNKFPITQLVYNQMWQTFFINIKITPNHIGKIRTCNSSKN